MKYFNTAIARRYKEKFQTKGESPEAFVFDEIVPTIEVSPVVERFYVANAAVSGNQTIFLTAADKDFYLTGLYWSVSHDANVTAGSLVGVVATTQEYQTTQYMVANLIPNGVSGNVSVFLPFNPPIKLQRGAALYISGTYAAGLVYRFASAFGYYEDPSSTLG